MTDLEDRVREASAEREAREAELDKYPSLPSEDEVNESETKTRNLRIASRHVAGLRERARANGQQAAAVQAAVAGFVGAPASAVSPGDPLRRAGDVRARRRRCSDCRRNALGRVGRRACSGVWCRYRHLAAHGENRSRPGATGSAGPGTVRPPMRMRRGSSSKRRSRKLASSAGELGFASIPTELELEERLAAIARQRALSATATNIAKLADAVRETEQDLIDRVEGAMQEKEQAETAQQQLLSDWDAWRTELGIPEPLKPDVAIEKVVPAIATAKDLLKQAAAYAQTDIAALREAHRGVRRVSDPSLESRGPGLHPARCWSDGRNRDAFHGKVLADEKQRERKRVSRPASVELGSTSRLPKQI